MRVRRPSQRFVQLFEQTRQPIYALDAQRRIVFANQAVVDWLDTPRERLIGATCNYHSRTDADLAQRMAASLSPPPEVFEGTACRGDVGGFLRDPQTESHATAHAAYFLPLNQESDGCAVLVFVDPLREQFALADPADAGSPTHRDLHRQIMQWRCDLSSRYRLDRMMGNSPAARTIQRTAKAAIESGADTLIVGPAGSGKEQLARAIHYSQYAAGAAPPLIPLDCTICDAESLQVALRQLQSDRQRSTRGRLLLLQIDRPNPALLTELSGFISLPTFEIGFLSTAESSLRAMAQRQEFDLHVAQHLSVLEITLPPLRERVQDLAWLCQSLVEDFNAEGNRQFSGLDPDALELLREYPWPGNLDELVQVVHEACQNAKHNLVQVSDLPSRVHHGIAASRIPRKPETTIELESFLREVEDELMRRAIRTAKGNKAKAARLLGVSRQRIIRWSEQNKNQ